MIIFIINILGVIASLIGLLSHYEDRGNTFWFTWFVVLFIINTTTLVLNINKYLTYV